MIASSGNRTRAALVAGEHSTTEPTMLDVLIGYKFFSTIFLERRLPRVKKAQEDQRGCRLGFPVFRVKVLVFHFIYFIQ
jgi:hypothetical protein